MFWKINEGMYSYILDDRLTYTILGIALIIFLFMLCRRDQ